MVDPLKVSSPTKLRRRRDAEHYVSIIESCEDAIISTDLEGTLESWNPGAEKLFGYRPHEVVGRSVTLLIPADREGEEDVILDRIRRGERVDHYETVRQRKDGSQVHVALTISPIRDASGRIVGASKVARDITERRQAQLQQSLLLREMDHRIKNLFTIAGSLVTLSAHRASTPSDLAAAVGKRLAALAQAHALTLSNDHAGGGHTTLHVLINTILSPFDREDKAEPSRFSVTGVDLSLNSSVLTSFALILHELATNSAKYGALVRPTGRVDVSCYGQKGRFVLTWEEHGGPIAEPPRCGQGFGSYLLQATSRQLDGHIEREWRPDGVAIRLSVPCALLRTNKEQRPSRSDRAALLEAR